MIIIINIIIVVELLLLLLCLLLYCYSYNTLIQTGMIDRNNMYHTINIYKTYICIAIAYTVH